MAVLFVGATGALMLTAGLPGNLLGSAPADLEWRAPAGQVQVVDGGTLRLPAGTVRLRGVEAPDRGERCTDRAGAGLDCGRASAEALARLVAGHDLTCHVSGRDQSGVGSCSAAGADLATGLVGGGWAVTDAARQPTLVSAQVAARSAGQGLWPGAPAGWRRRP